MRYLVTQTMSASKRRYWIVKDTGHGSNYCGPFAGEAEAQAFVTYQEVVCEAEEEQAERQARLAAEQEESLAA
jgi:hypothetical protein